MLLGEGSKMSCNNRKRIRSKNFSEEEKALMVVCMEPYMEVIEGNNKGKKDEAWARITEKFNANTKEIHRDVHNLTSYYRNWKTKFKREQSGETILITQASQPQKTLRRHSDQNEVLVGTSCKSSRTQDSQNGGKTNGNASASDIQQGINEFAIINPLDSELQHTTREIKKEDSRANSLEGFKSLVQDDPLVASYQIYFSEESSSEDNPCSNKIKATTSNSQSLLDKKQQLINMKHKLLQMEMEHKTKMYKLEYDLKLKELELLKIKINKES